MTHLLHEFHAEYAWLSPCTVHLKLSQHNCANWLLFYHMKEKVKKNKRMDVLFFRDWTWNTIKVIKSRVRRAEAACCCAFRVPSPTFASERRAGQVPHLHPDRRVTYTAP